MVTHRMTKIVQPQNLTRSAIAPEIRAGVMIANMSWNMAKTRTGTPAVNVVSVIALPTW